MAPLDTKWHASVSQAPYTAYSSETFIQQTRADCRWGQIYPLCAVSQTADVLGDTCNTQTFCK